MKFYYDINAPSPRKPRILVAEKGVQDQFEWIKVDVPGRETRQPHILKKNPFGRVPILELDDGSIIWESASIARYVDRLFPEPSCFGTTPLEEAEIDMWARRVEFGLYQPIEYVHGFRDHDAGVAARYQRNVDDMIHTLDGVLAIRDFIAGDTFSFADIVAIATIDYGLRYAEAKLPSDAPAVVSWYKRMWERPSVQACQDDYEGAIDRF